MQRMTQEDLDEAASSKRDQHQIFNMAKKSLGISLREMREIGRHQTGAKLSKLAFLLVLVGCELDLVGFAMGFGTYFALPHNIVKVMLVSGPVGYFLAVIMYKCFNRNSSESEKKAVSGERDRRGETGEGVTADLENPIHTTTHLNTKEPISIKLYHILPVLRYYLAIKDLEANDVEALFRANTLSSFTLGTAQAVAFIFTLLEGAELTIFVKISITSFIMNWVITLMYYVTPVSQKMKASVMFDAITYNGNKQLAEDYVELLTAVQLRSHCPVKKYEDKVQKWRNMVANEIFEFTREQIPLDTFEPSQLAHLRMLVRKKHAQNEMAKMSS